MRQQSEPPIPRDQSDVFFYGIVADPQLNHPEGLAVDADGTI